MPILAQALVLNADDNTRLRLETIDVPDPEAGEATVQLQAAALNHRDEWIRQGQYAGIKYPSILGSDGCGVVTAVGTGVDAAWVGRQVVINPNIDWGADPAIQGPHYTIRGLQQGGTFSTHLTLPVHRLHAMPAHLTPEQAAALPLAGLTAYRAVMRYGKPAPGMQVLITGIGGGVALFALQFALAAGATCYVTSSEDKKINKAISLGAVAGANYKKDTWWKELKSTTGGFHLIIDSGGGDGVNGLIELTKPAGTLVFYGATASLPRELNLRKIFWNQLRLQGSTMGNDQEFADMLQLVTEKKLVPVVSSVRPFVDILEAFAEIRAGKQFGKLVVKME